MCITAFNPSEPCCGNAEPTPYMGVIYRIMKPEPIDDYEGFSDTQWSSGTTGHPSAEWNTNCVYHHFTVASRREDSQKYILPPVRWSVAAPEFDGGNYDAWDLVRDNQFKPHNLGFPIGYMPLRDKFLPAKSHGRFVNNQVQLSFLGVPPLELCSSETGDSYIQSELQAIEPGIVPAYFDGSSGECFVNVRIEAIRHRVDGQPVKRLFIVDDFGDESTWRCRVLPHQSYSIDVWYSAQHIGALSNPETPGKCCVFLSLNRVDNGSTRTGGRSNFMPFGNVDFSSAFSHENHTYNVTVSGHKGWTLKDGSNGPHKITTGGGWVGGSYPGNVGFQNLSAAEHLRLIRIEFFTECAQVVLYPGAALIAKGVLGPFVYRATQSTSFYRQRAFSTDFGEINIAPNGRFDQAGTTTFALVPWTLTGGFEIGDDQWFFDGEGANYAGPPIPREVPRTITITRTGI